MTRDRILVTGANGLLGMALLRALGPQRTYAATRTGQSPLAGFEHVALDTCGVPSLHALARSRAVINGINNSSDEAETMYAANIDVPKRIAYAAKAAGVQKLVQVSSFSIFGTAELIDAHTAEQPSNAYGRSKAAADAALLEFADEKFAVETLRLPFMFSTTAPGLLAPLLAMCTKLRFLPTVKGRPLQRSMITHADAARQLIDCAETRRSGKSFAADPQPFDYDLLTSLVRQELGVDARTIAVPKTFARGIDLMLPAVGRRLFSSSLLAPAANIAGDRALGLECELRDLLKINHRIAR